MGRPKKVQPALRTNVDFGPFGSANAQGVNLSGVGAQNVSEAQTGTQNYLRELLNPSYSNPSFQARQDILDASNRQFANEMGASAIARGARGGVTQNILNSIAANRNMDMRNAMTTEDQRIRAILGQTGAIESQGLNTANALANNILQRAGYTQQANMYNTQARNDWVNNLISGGAGVVGSVLGSIL